MQAATRVRATELQLDEVDSIFHFSAAIPRPITMPSSNLQKVVASTLSMSPKALYWPSHWGYSIMAAAKFLRMGHRAF
jgi:hypothetical protein